MTNANMQEKNLNGGGKPSKRKEEEDSNPMNGVTASGCETSGIPKKDYSRSKAGSREESTPGFIGSVLPQQRMTRSKVGRATTIDTRSL